MTFVPKVTSGFSGCLTPPTRLPGATGEDRSLVRITPTPRRLLLGMTLRFFVSSARRKGGREFAFNDRTPIPAKPSHPHLSVVSLQENATNLQHLAA